MDQTTFPARDSANNIDDSISLRVKFSHDESHHQHPDIGSKIAKRKKSNQVDCLPRDFMPYKNS